MRQAAAVTTIIVLVALSGCLGSGTDPTAPSADGNGTDPDTDATSSGPDPAAGSTNASTEEGSDPDHLGNVTVNWDGSTGVKAMACIPTLYCTGAHPATENERNVDAPQTSGDRADWNRTLTGALNMTWNAQDTTTEELRISFDWTEPCGSSSPIPFLGGCTIMHEVASASGSSPVTLELDQVNVPGNRTLRIDVSGQEGIHTDQSFHVEGTIAVAAVPADG